MQAFAQDNSTFVTSVFIAKEEDARVATFRALTDDFSKSVFWQLLAYHLIECQYPLTASGIKK